MVLYMRQLEDCAQPSERLYRQQGRLQPIYRNTKIALDHMVRNKDRGLHIVISLIDKLVSSPRRLEDDQAPGTTSYCSTAGNSIELERRVMRVVNGLHSFFRKSIQSKAIPVLKYCQRSRTGYSQAISSTHIAVTMFVAVCVPSSLLIVVIVKILYSSRRRKTSVAATQANGLSLSLQTVDASQSTPSHDCPSAS